MKKILCPIMGVSAALFLCSCSSFQPTRSLEEALADVENQIGYITRESMEKNPEVTAPRLINPEQLRKSRLNFAFAFDQGKVAEDTYNFNRLNDREWESFKVEFENAIAGSRRFPAAQLMHGMADKKLRERTRAGSNTVPELNKGLMIKPDGILHLRPILSISESLDGKEKTLTHTFNLNCFPADPVNHAPLKGVPSFSVKVNSKIYQLVGSLGRPVAGFRFNSEKQLEDFHLRQGRAAIVRFFEQMYKMFPVGGFVTNIDEDGNMLIKASREEGLQPNMEMIVFALKKSDGDDAIPVPLYNATAVTVGDINSSTLKIWRKSKKTGAKKIIAKIEKDLEEAKEEYDFIAASFGFAQWPDFVQQQNTVKK